EPFLHPDFYSILMFSAEKVPSISIYTNGSLITDKWIRKIKSLTGEIKIGIKFDSPLTYESHTLGQVPFEKVESNIRKCVNNNLPVIAFITVTKLNSRYVGDMIKSSIDLGAFPVLERYNPVKDPQINQILEIDKKDWSRALSMYSHFYSDISNVYETAKILHRGLCECYRNVVSITSDGYVLPCAFLPVKQSLGNIKEESLSEIWLEYEKRRQEWFMIPEECKECEKAYLCGGGCKTHSYLKYGNMNEKDPLCSGKILPLYSRMGGLSISKKSKKDNLFNKEL
ncbi:MAG: SPASM domain-containing protein, partial [Promethearchaeota archaeon]